MSYATPSGDVAPDLPTLPSFPLPLDPVQRDQSQFDTAASAFRAALTASLARGDARDVVRTVHRLLDHCEGRMVQLCQLLHCGRAPSEPEGREVLFEAGMSAVRAPDVGLASELGLFLHQYFRQDPTTGPQGAHLLALARESSDPDYARRWLNRANSDYWKRGLEMPDDLRALKARLDRRVAARRGASRRPSAPTATTDEETRRPQRAFLPYEGMKRRELSLIRRRPDAPMFMQFRDAKGHGIRAPRSIREPWRQHLATLVLTAFDTAVTEDDIRCELAKYVGDEVPSLDSALRDITRMMRTACRMPPTWKPFAHSKNTGIAWADPGPIKSVVVEPPLLPVHASARQRVPARRR